MKTKLAYEVSHRVFNGLQFDGHFFYPLLAFRVFVVTKKKKKAFIIIIFFWKARGGEISPRRVGRGVSAMASIKGN